MEEREVIEKFLKVWPISKIETMELKEYANTSQEAFLNIKKTKKD